MKKNNSKTSDMSTGQKIAVGAGAAAVAAGAYYLLGPNSKEHKKKAKALLAKIEMEVKREAVKAKKLAAPVYHKAIDAISEKYAEEYKMHEKEIKAFAKRLKGKAKTKSK